MAYSFFDLAQIISAATSITNAAVASIIPCWLPADKTKII